MSQLEVLRIIRNLGGRAILKDIIQYAKENYPGLSLHQYACNRITKLKKWGYLIEEFEGEKRYRALYIITPEGETYLEEMEGAKK